MPEAELQSRRGAPERAPERNAAADSACPARPLVSVIVPSHGNAAHLAEALVSVRAQSYEHWEIVVVADGKSNAAEACSDYPDVRLVTQPHQGVSVARNRGLSETSGEYVVFLDADDTLLPDALATGITALQEHPDAALVYGRCVWMSRDGSPLATPSFPTVEREHYLALLRMNFIPIHAAMHRRSTLEAVGGFRPGLHMAEDYELYLRLARVYSFHEHGACVARNRRHSTSASRDAAAMLGGVLTVLGWEQDHLPKGARYRAALQAGLTGLQGYWGGKIADQIRADVNVGNWRAALRATAVLLRHDPRSLVENGILAIRTRLVRVADAISG